MRCRLPLTTCALFAGLLLSPASSIAQTSSSSYKVLASEERPFNVKAVKSLIKKGDKAASSRNYKKAKNHYDEARIVSRQLLSFYRDLSGAFRGLDARIPREMDSKSLDAATALADVNLRLAALFRRQNQPEMAVPVLVEVVRLMTPAKPQGNKAYQGLIELGFAETPYAAGR